MSQQIQPLRINKGTPLSSPTKMKANPVQLPLAELSPMERRRNSPSFNQNAKGLGSSPFDSSSFASKFNTSPFASASPRAYWQNRDSPSPTRSSLENRDPRETSPAPPKRSSIENLKRASRVKNSNMFAREHKQEYDPTSVPLVERPLAAGRPFNASFLGNGTPQEKPRQDDINSKELPVNQLMSPSKCANIHPDPEKSSAQGPVSPSKSSLSKNSRYGYTFETETGILPDDDDSVGDRQLPPGKYLHRHAKSVTFDAAPPQVNEYEMTTPDPSSVASGSREGSYESTEGDEDEEGYERDSDGNDDSFDASLEDTDKTPVVLPEDWRFMSPATANDELAAKMDDPFDGETGSPSPGAMQTSNAARMSPTRTDSVNSNGERRPLPPLPPLGPPVFPRARSDSNGSLQAAAERVTSLQRTLPSAPRPASISKAELQDLGSSSMSLEDRLRLMMLQEEEKSVPTKSAGEGQRERRLRRAGANPDRSPEDKGLAIQVYEDEVENDEVADLGKYQLPPRISRESILRKVKNQTLHSDYEYSSPAPSYPGPQADKFDPDVPIPSLEDQADTTNAIHDEVVIKQEDSDSEVDVYAIPEMYRHQPEATESATANKDFPVSRTVSQGSKDDDDESQYSTDLNGEKKVQAALDPADSGPPTPRAATPLKADCFKEDTADHRLSLSQFASMLGEEGFGQSLSSYMTPSPPVDEIAKSQDAQSAPVPVTSPPEIDRPSTPQEKIISSSSEEETGTPDSVIRHSVPDIPVSEAPAIAEPVATIKAPGSNLKTRASLMPADAKTMAETRRKVSNERPPVPAIPERHASRPSVIPERNSILPEADVSEGSEDGTRQGQRKSSLVQLDLPVEEIDQGLSFGLDREFDRVMEAQKVPSDPFPSRNFADSSAFSTAEYIGGQGFYESIQNFANISPRRQKGYLMRQNTKMVVASSASHESSGDSSDVPQAGLRGTRSAGNSPVKSSQAGTWTTEPWNGKIRRKSIRQSAGSLMKPPATGGVPPLPGARSNVTTGLDTVNESNPPQEVEEVADGGERGRLFVKVVGVKELDLPLPRGERSYFALTLDNGLHCVTTAWLELGKFAPIGQEFELVVLEELEFQLTLQTKIEEPKPVKVETSPTKPKAPKQSAFSRVFQSPKKRKELELKQQEEAQRLARQAQLDAQSSKKNGPTAWELLHNLVAKDGSFARSYVSLKDHEQQAFGRPYTVDVPCFNEWSVEESRTLGSSKSGRGATAASMQRKPPYRIGKLELQLLFVPKPKDATDDDLPKSMNACVRELQEAENASKQSWEGHLSQQGGDCPYWRRRYFRLDGPKLTAYHEATHQPRATINLTKASKLIDDKSSLIQKEVSGKGGSRRRSAFAAEEEGYMFVEEGFRVRFANGEVIDFYADSRADKESWMRALAEVVGKDNKSARNWTEIVLKRERVAATRAARAQPTNAVGMKSAPSTPAAKQSSPQKVSYSRPLSQQQGPRPNSSDKPLPSKGRDPRSMAPAERRQKTRSMMF